MKIHNIHRLVDYRKELRKNPTPQEEKLWQYLKEKKLGVKFRRQHSISGYILDFFCKEKRLVIEIDGGIHEKEENKEYDKVRDKYLESLNYQVLRFKNRQVDEDVRGVVREIKENLK